MDEQSVHISKYHVLHTRGVLLDDATIDAVLEAVDDGVKLAEEYFHFSTDNTGLCIHSDDKESGMGYAPDSKAINIPIYFLNAIHNGWFRAATMGMTLTMNIEEYELRIPLCEYLVAGGIEETIHHLQHVGAQMCISGTSAHLPIEWGDRYNELGTIGKILCPHEIEARTLTDAVLLTHNRRSVWRDYEEHLKAKYPDRYGKSFEEQLTIEKTSPE